MRGRLFGLAEANGEHPMNRQDKAAVVEELRESLDNVSAVVLTEYRGLDVPSVVELRQKLRESGVHYRVVKNTLAKLAIEGTDKEYLSEHLQGPIAIAWSDDAVAPAKVLCGFAKDHEGLTIKAGYLSGNPVDVDGLNALALLPGKDELRSKLLSVFMGSGTKLVTVLTQVPRNFLSVLKQREEQLG